MNRVPVSSSSIKSVGHDGTAVMEVEFKNGAVYQYHGVSKDDYDAFVSAGSIGKHFATNFRNAKATRVS